MNRRITTALLCALSLTAAACETPQEAMVGEPPAEEETVGTRQGGLRSVALPGAKKNQSERRYPEPIFGAAVWPFLEEGKSFELTWGGPATALGVHERPNPNSAVVGEYSLQKSQKIPWRNTWVSVYEPAIFTATTRVDLQGTRHAPDNRDLHQVPVSATVDPGEKIAVYHYAGAAKCFVGAGQTLMETSCPTPAQFEGDFSGRTRAEQMHPQKRVWWVFVETQQATGWIPVDDRVLVDILNI